MWDDMESWGRPETQESVGKTSEVKSRSASSHQGSHYCGVGKKGDLLSAVIFLIIPRQTLNMAELPFMDIP